MTESQIIDSLGGTNAVARICKVKPGSVSCWRKYGIPDARKQTLALIFPDKVPKSWAPSPANKAKKTPEEAA